MGAGLSRCAVLWVALLAPLAAHAAANASCPSPASPEIAAATRPLALPPGVHVGVALGSGSMHGIAHIGAIQELEERGLPVEVVTGTSVGALVGSLWASGLTGREIEALGRRDDLYELGRFTGSFQGLFDSEAMRAPLEAAFQRRPIESWPKRFGAVATNLDNGERRIIARGDGATAVQASSAVPVLYRPIAIDKERLVDGALVEPVPVNAARELGANFVIGIDVAYRPHEEPARGITQYAFQAMHILVNSLAAQQIRSADIAIRLDLHRQFVACGNDALIAAGREAVRRAWPDVQRALAARAARRAAK